VSYINPRVRRRFMGDDSDAPVIDVAPTEDTSSTPDVSTVADTSGGTFVSAGGVCKPTTSAYLDLYKGLQRQANRVASVISVPMIAVDGAIGAGTLGVLAAIKAMKVVQGAPNAINQAAALALVSAIDTSSCSVVATNVVAYTASLSNAADALGASDSVSSPSPASTPSYVNPSTGVPQTQPLTSSVADLFNNMSSTQQYLLGAGAALLAYMTFKKNKAKSAVTRRTTRRR
jgi:lysozyme family protein